MSWLNPVNLVTDVVTTGLNTVAAVGNVAVAGVTEVAKGAGNVAYNGVAAVGNVATGDLKSAAANLGNAVYAPVAAVGAVGAEAMVQVGRGVFESQWLGCTNFPMTLSVAPSSKYDWTIGQLFKSARPESNSESKTVRESWYHNGLNHMLVDPDGTQRFRFKYIYGTINVFAPPTMSSGPAVLLSVR
jgi:hypothetical protein